MSQFSLDCTKNRSSCDFFFTPLRVWEVYAPTSPSEIQWTATTKSAVRCLYSCTVYIGLDSETIHRYMTTIHINSIRHLQALNIATKPMTLVATSDSKKWWQTRIFDTEFKQFTRWHYFNNSFIHRQPFERHLEIRNAMV